MTPPVGSASRWTLPPVTALSRTLKNSSAMAPFLASKDFLRSRDIRLCAISDFFWAVLLKGFSWSPLLLRFSTDPVLVLVSELPLPLSLLLSSFSSSFPGSLKSHSSSSSAFRVVLFFCGECWSFQSLVASWCQKESVLSRYGVGGIRSFSFVGDRGWLFDGVSGTFCIVFFSDGLLAGEWFDIPVRLKYSVSEN